MNAIEQFTIDNWITIASMVIPIFLGLIFKIHLWLWSFIKNHFIEKQIEVITPSFEDRFASLNKQTRVCPFLDKNGHLSLSSLLDNHRAVFKTSTSVAGKLRANDVYIKCYKVNDSAGGTILVSREEQITNLIPAEEVHLTLFGIIDDWNKKAEKVKTYSEKDRIEFVSRFHIYFQMVHPFLDGNGRIGRSLLEEQLSYLFNKIFHFQPDINAYHRCIEAGIRGDESELRKLISDQVKLNA